MIDYKNKDWLCIHRCVNHLCNDCFPKEVQSARDRLYKLREWADRCSKGARVDSPSWCIAIHVYDEVSGILAVIEEPSHGPATTTTE